MTTSSTPKLEKRAEQPCVFIPIKATYAEWGKANALVPEVYGWLAQHGYTPNGPLFYRYVQLGDMQQKPFKLEIGVPVQHPIPCNDPVHPGTIPGGAYAVLLHEGHPDRLMQSFEVLEAWAEKENVIWDTHEEAGEKIWAGRFEFYLTNPAEQPDPEQWTTEIAWLTRS